MKYWRHASGQQKGRCDERNRRGGGGRVAPSGAEGCRAEPIPPHYSPDYKTLEERPERQSSSTGLQDNMLVMMKTAVSHPEEWLWYEWRCSSEREWQVMWRTNQRIWSDGICAKVRPTKHAFWIFFRISIQEGLNFKYIELTRGSSVSSVLRSISLPA